MRACDLITASDDAFLRRPRDRNGIAGVVYCVRPLQITSCAATAFLFLGEPISAAWA